MTVPASLSGPSDEAVREGLEAFHGFVCIEGSHVRCRAAVIAVLRSTPSVPSIVWCIPCDEGRHEACSSYDPTYDCDCAKSDHRLADVV